MHIRKAFFLDVPVVLYVTTFLISSYGCPQPLGPGMVGATGYNDPTGSAKLGEPQWRNPGLPAMNPAVLPGTGGRNSGLGGQFYQGPSSNILPQSEGSNLIPSTSPTSSEDSQSAHPIPSVYYPSSGIVFPTSTNAEEMNEREGGNQEAMEPGLFQDTSRGSMSIRITRPPYDTLYYNPRGTPCPFDQRDYKGRCLSVPNCLDGNLWDPILGPCNRGLRLPCYQGSVRDPITGLCVLVNPLLTGTSAITYSKVLL